MKTFMRTWEEETFRLVAMVVAVSDRFSSDSTHELSVHGSVVAAMGSSASFVAVSGESYVLANIYGDYLDSGYDRKLIEFPFFDLAHLKRCLQKVSSSGFWSLDLFSMMEFIITRLKGAEHRDWLMSRSGLPRAIISGELSMPSLLEVVRNVVGVWPPIVVYLKKIRKRTDGDKLVVYYNLYFYSTSE